MFIDVRGLKLEYSQLISTLFWDFDKELYVVDRNNKNIILKKAVRKYSIF